MSTRTGSHWRTALLAVVLVSSCTRGPVFETPEVLIPAGEFRVGVNCHTGNLELSCDCAIRDHRAILRLPAFYIDRRLVTRAQFMSCVAAGACAADFRELAGLANDKHDTVRRFHDSLANVRHEQAASFCRWRGARLPTSDEFERAARGTDGRRHPWGEHGRGPCQDPSGMKCQLYKNPVGVRSVAYNRQWVAERNEDYPLGVTRGDDDLTFCVSNEEYEIVGKDGTLVRDGHGFPYAAFRCARSAPAATNVADHAP